MNLKQFPEIMKQKRLELGYSAEYVGKQIGVAKTTIYRYESGEIKKMPISQYKKICKILNISPNTIFQEDNEPIETFDEYIKKTELKEKIEEILLSLTTEEQEDILMYAKKLQSKERK